MKLRDLSVNRMHRLYLEVSTTGKKLAPKLNKKDKQLYNTKMKQLKKLYKRTMTLYIIRAVIAVLLYISIISFIFGDLIILEWFTDILIVIAGILGTTILAGLLYALQVLINVYISDAHLVADYIIALDVKYHK